MRNGSRIPSPPTHTPRCLRIAALGAAFAALAFALVGLAPSPAVAQPGIGREPGELGVECIAPSIDGSLQDMIDFATCPDLDGCGHVVNDDPQDVCVTDGLVDPCTTPVACAAGGVGYFVNGTDITRAVAAYDRPNDVTYLGMRTVGQIGDADGDGNDFIGGTCNGTNINDQDGIGSNEPYIWSFDLDCDGIFGEAANNEPIVQVANNVVSVQNHASGATSFDYVGPSGGTDLEVSVAGLGLPAIWRFRAFIGFTFDGKSEDLAVSPLCPEPDLGLLVSLDCPGVLCVGTAGDITATVTNTSEVALANVHLSIPLPAGLTFVGIVDDDGWDSSSGNGTVTADESSLPIAGVRTLTFTVRMEEECTAASHHVGATATGSFSQPGCVELSGTQGEGGCDIRCSDAPCEITGDNEICQGEFTEFCGPAGQSGYAWTGPGGFTGSDQCTGTIGIDGTYTLTVTNADGCPTTCGRRLFVRPLPVCFITGDNDICADETTNFCVFLDLAGNGLLYSWTGPGGFTASTECTGPINTPGLYTATLTNEFGCSSSCERLLTVHDLPRCDIKGDNVICGGQKSTFFCGPDAMTSYSWTGPGGFTGSDQCTGTITEAGFYYLTIVDKNGCDNTCNLELFVDTPPRCDISGDNELCLGETTEFCAYLANLSGNLGYAWTGPGGFTSSDECTGTISTPGLYSVTITDENGCTGSCERNLIVYPLPFCDITGDTEVCEGECSQFCAAFPDDAQVYGADLYSWTGPGGFTSTDRCVQVCVAGEYTVVVEGIGGCTSRCSETLIVHDNPTCSITGDEIICDDETSDFCGPAGFAEYAWTGPGGFTASTRCTGSINTGGTYELTVTDQFGCEGTCELTLTVEACEECCWMTSGGFLNACSRSGHKDDNFGGNVGPPPHGSWQHVQRIDNEITFNFHSHDANVLECHDTGDPDPCHPAGEADSIVFGGTGEYSEGNGRRDHDAWWIAYVADNGEPGRRGGEEGGCGYPDYYAIYVYSDAAKTQLVFSATGVLGCTDEGGNLDGGNLQVRDCRQAQNDAEFMAAVQTYWVQYYAYREGSSEQFQTSVESGLGAVDLFKPIPNPFTQTTRMAYAVTGQGASQVEIGVYNTSGQKVRSLVSAVLGPGRYEVVWDGRDDRGTSVPAGVYFYRSAIGGQSVVSRVVHMR
jgi:hypothetical protein